jgi:hypothetical protein
MGGQTPSQGAVGPSDAFREPGTNLGRMTMIVGALWVSVHCTTLLRVHGEARVLAGAADSPLRERSRRVTIRRKPDRDSTRDPTKKTRGNVRDARTDDR